MYCRRTLPPLLAPFAFSVSVNFDARPHGGAPVASCTLARGRLHAGHARPAVCRVQLQVCFLAGSVRGGKEGCPWTPRKCVGLFAICAKRCCPCHVLELARETLRRMSARAVADYYSSGVCNHGFVPCRWVARLANRVECAARAQGGGGSKCRVWHCALWQDVIVPPPAVVVFKYRTFMFCMCHCRYSRPELKRGITQSNMRIHRGADLHFGTCSVDQVLFAHCAGGPIRRGVVRVDSMSASICCSVIMCLGGRAPSRRMVGQGLGWWSTNYFNLLFFWFALPCHETQSACVWCYDGARRGLPQHCVPSAFAWFGVAPSQNALLRISLVMWHPDKFGSGVGQGPSSGVICVVAHAVHAVCVHN